MGTLLSIGRIALVFLVASAASGLVSSAPAMAEVVSGQVLGAGAPIEGSAVTLWAAGAGAPTQLAQSTTGGDGRFSLNADIGGDDLYLVARGGRPGVHPQSADNPAVVLINVVGLGPSCQRRHQRNDDNCFGLDP